MPETALKIHISQWAIQAITRTVGAYAMVQGVAIVLGGRERWSGPSFVRALQLPGAPASWGWILALLGLLVLASTFAWTQAGVRPLSFRAVALGLFGISAWSMFFALTFVDVAYLNTPETFSNGLKPATTGIYTYFLQSCICTLLAFPYLLSGPRRR